MMMLPCLNLSVIEKINSTFSLTFKDLLLFNLYHFSKKFVSLINIHITAHYIGC